MPNLYLWTHLQQFDIVSMSSTVPSCIRGQKELLIKPSWFFYYSTFLAPTKNIIYTSILNTASLTATRILQLGFGCFSSWSVFWRSSPTKPLIYEICFLRPAIFILYCASFSRQRFPATVFSPNTSKVSDHFRFCWITCRCYKEAITIKCDCLRWQLLCQSILWYFLFHLTRK